MATPTYYSLADVLDMQITAEDIILQLKVGRIGQFYENA
jgi:hypothetical protein